jgi:hypothetical protein
MTTFNLRNVKVKPTRLNNLLDPIIISVDPSRESEPKDFHLNYSLVGLSLKCLYFLSYKSEALLPFDSVCRGVG